jgi:hypothetical protein
MHTHTHKHTHTHTHIRIHKETHKQARLSTKTKIAVIYCTTNRRSDGLQPHLINIQFQKKTLLSVGVVCLLRNATCPLTGIMKSSDKRTNRADNNQMLKHRV